MLYQLIKEQKNGLSIKHQLCGVFAMVLLFLSVFLLVAPDSKLWENNIGETFTKELSDKERLESDDHESASLSNKVLRQSYFNRHPMLSNLKEKDLIGKLNQSGIDSVRAPPQHNNSMNLLIAT